MFNEIADEGFDMFFHMGDLHYENIDRNSTSRFQDAYDIVHGSAAQQRLYVDS